MGHLQQELVLDVLRGVRVTQEHAAADHAEQREDQGRAPRRQPSAADHPLEDAEDDDEQHEDPVLRHRRDEPALPETLGAERPRARIVAQDHEGGQPEEHERPVPRPAGSARGVQQGQQAHDEDQDSGHVVVELGPGAIGVVAGGQRIVDRHLGDRGRAERGHPWGEARRDLRQRGPVVGEIHRGRQRGERGGREEHNEAQADLDLHEATERDLVGLGGAVHPADRPGVQRAQHEQAAQDHHLGQDHEAVRGAEDRAQRRGVVPR